MNKPFFVTDTDWKLLKEKYHNIEKIKPLLYLGYPIQYLIGNVDFYGYNFLVNKNVLIPRFETEGLLEKTLDIIKKQNLEGSKVLDIGTGSGVIAITLKKELPLLDVSAIDISEEALNVARENAKLNKVNVNFKCTDIFNYNLNDKFDIIISNPPYIEDNSNYDKKILFEPSKAIFVDSSNPLIYYKQILEVSLKCLNKKHLIAFEIDEDKGEELIKLIKNYYPNDKISLENDLTGKNRYIFILNNE